MSEKHDANLPFREREINGRSYQAYALPLDKWADLTEFLTDIVGEPLGALLRGDAVLPDEHGMPMGRGDLQALIGSLVSKVSAKRIIDLTRHMGRSLRVGGSILDEKKQNMWWPKHMRDLVPAVVLFLEAQYSDFYGGLDDSLPQPEINDDLPCEMESDTSESPSPSQDRG